MSPKQQIFVAEYLLDFNGTRAAKRAGYGEKNARITAAKLLSIPEIKQAIQNGIEIRKSELIADRFERMAFLSQTMRDTNESMKLRIKACEILSKIDGDITIKNDSATLAEVLLQLK